jgi:hypothetical protein
MATDDNILLLLTRGEIERSMDKLEKTIKLLYKSFKEDNKNPSDKEGLAYGYAFGYIQKFVEDIEIIVPNMPKDKIGKIQKETIEVFRKRINNIIDSITDM